jgi:hypothetical protein
MKRLLPILISLLHSPKSGAAWVGDAASGLGVEQFSSPRDGAVEIESQWTARHREQAPSPPLGCAQPRRIPAQEKLGRTTLEGKVGALAGPPCRSRGSTRETKLKTL